jgi:hypothetical protein
MSKEETAGKAVLEDAAVNVVAVMLNIMNDPTADPVARVEAAKLVISRHMETVE